MSKNVIQLGVGKAASPTASDTVDTAFVSNSVWCTTLGIVRVTLAGMEDGVFVDYTLAVDTRYPLRVKRLWATTTTAVILIEE